MDLQIALLSVGVCAISAVVVYLISVFGMREKTYEEAIEEQRKRNQEANQQSKVEKPKKEKKFKKPSKRAKESRNSEEEVEQSANNHVNDHVDFKPDAEIIPVDPDPEVKPAKSKKKLRAPKSILLNKQEVGPIAADILTASDDNDDKDVNDSPPAFVPMDEVERRHSLDIGQKKWTSLIQNAQPSLETTAALEVKSNVTEVGLMPSESKIQSETIQEKKAEETTKKNRKPRADSSEMEIEPSFKKLLATIKKQHLMDEEIHSLVEILLNKQQSGAEWQKKNDPVASLKKQLAEKEMALEGEQRASQTANNKLREVRQELTNEKARLTALERNLRQEVMTTHSRLQATIDQQAKSQQAHNKALEEQMQNLQCLNEEKVSLQQQLQLIEVERQKWATHEREIQREIEERYQASLVQEQERMGLQLQAKESQLQQVIVAQQEGDFQCSQAIAELKQQLQESQTQLASLSQEVEAERSSMRQRHEEKEKLMRKQEEEMQRFKRMTEEERLQLQSHADMLQGQVNNANNQIQDHDCQVVVLREEATALRQQLAKAQKQVESMEALGDTQSAQLQQEKNLLNTRLADVGETLEQCRADFTKVQSELEAQKIKNNELREKNWKAMDAMNSLEKDLKERGEAHSKELVQVQDEKEKALQQLREQHAEQLQQQQTQKVENEGALSGDHLQRIQEEERTCLQRVLPDAEIDSSLEHSTWLERFVEKVQEKLSTVSTLKAENSSLGAQINHYQTVLSDTETMLKNLQNRVEDQENQWTERVARKDAETQKILQEKSVLEEQLQQLQGIEEATAEMQGRLKELQAKLQGEESDRKQIETKAEEAQQRCTAVTSELESKKEEVERLRKEMETLGRVNAQADELQKDLEKERKITKELGSQVVKLNSLVKIGQDALRAEQDLVKQLQLQAQTTPCSNGNNINNNNNNNNNKIPADNGTVVENEGASGKK